MTAVGRRALPVLLALVLAGAWGAALGLQHVGGRAWFLDRVEATLTDIRMVLRGRRPPPGVVAIVAIDDRTVLSEGGYPLPRDALAGLVTAVRALQPKAIALDMLLIDRGPAAGDEALAAALGAGNSVIAGAALFAGGRQWVAGGARTADSVPVAQSFLLPQAAFLDAAALGIVNVATDQSGTPRFQPLIFRTGDRLEAALVLRAAALALGQDPTIAEDDVVLADHRIPTDLGHLLPIGFYGPRGTIATFSAADVLAGRLDRSAIAGKVVVIGATVTGGGDVFPTPFDPVMPGVEVVSTAISHLLAGDGLRRDRSTRLADAATAIVLPTILVGLIAWRRSLAGLVAVAAILAGWLALNMALFAHGIWLSLAVPLAAAVPPLALFGAVELWLDRRRAVFFADRSALLSQFQAPGLGDYLTRHPDFLATPVRLEAAVLFIDLSGFTGVSEVLGANQVRELLNTFQSLVAEEVVACGGVITGFAGDGAMILFGLPNPAADDARRAARCAMRLTARTRAWIATLPSSTAARIGFKLGAHFGPAVASRLGGAGHQHITATGDTVNVASRLMEVAATQSVDLVMSGDFLAAAGEDAFGEGELEGPLQTRIRGRSGSLTVWSWRP